MTRRTISPAAAALALAAAIVALQALLVPLFAGPATSIEPRDLPLVVAGPEAATSAFAERLEQAQPGAFEITTVADAEAADAALRNREAYGAFVLGPQGLQLHTASAASPTVAALLTQAVGHLSQGQPVEIVDVVPTEAGDPRGAGFASGFFPLAITAMMAGIAMFFVVRRPLARLLGLVAFAGLAGLVGVTVLQQWLGVIGGDWFAVATAVALFSLAVSATMTGLASLLGPPGMGAGAALIILVGNALSGLAAAPELLPQPWGEFGQWLPIGAGATLLRSVGWFDGAGGTFSAWLLIGWATVGLLLVALTGRAGTSFPANSPTATSAEVTAADTSNPRAQAAL